jgi:hypothetical protein
VEKDLTDPGRGDLAGAAEIADPFENGDSLLLRVVCQKFLEALKKLRFADHVLVVPP